MKTKSHQTQHLEARNNRNKSEKIRVGANPDESGGGSKSTQTNMGISSNPMRDSQVEEVGGGALNGERLKQIDCNKFAAKTEVKQLHREESTVEGKRKKISGKTNCWWHKEL